MLRGETYDAMKVTVVGTGYVGLVAGVCFADAGHVVTCVDVDTNKIELLKRGEVPIYEPGLGDILKRAQSRLTFTSSLEEALVDSKVVFVAVGTPELPDGSADLGPTRKVVESVANSRSAASGLILVLKSTVPIGTAKALRNELNQLGRQDFEIVSNPEFLKEGAAIDDFMRPDRVVIGCSSQRAQSVMEELYEPFVRHGAPILFMDNTSAEMTKYAANAFLSVKISFVNELALLADAVGADIDEVRRGFTSDRRINPAFFQPGVGFGGSCFPKDVKALVHTGRVNGLQMSVVDAADSANDRQKTVLFDRLASELSQRGQTLKGLTVAVWGLAFKPETDDVREAPSIEIIQRLVDAGCRVRAYDPVAHETIRPHIPGSVVLCRSTADSVVGADALMLITDWNEFKNPDWSNLKTNMKGRLILDGRNVFDPTRMAELGFEYVCIGRQIQYHDSLRQLDPTAASSTQTVHTKQQKLREVAVVAGAAGFVGSHLVDFLLETGRFVIGIDSLVTGRVQNLEHAFHQTARFRFIKRDISESGLLQLVQKELSQLAALNRFNPSDLTVTEVYNLASPASPVDFSKIPLEILETAAVGHRQMLDLARSYDATCLFASSSEVYGDAEQHPQTEDYFGNVNPIGHRSCYDEAKRYGEALSTAHFKKLGTKIRIARIFNTYGPRMRPDDGRIIPNFFIQALQGQPLTVYGSGSQTRSLCYVSDLVRGLVVLMESSEVRPVNIGGATEKTALEIAGLINSLTENQAGIRNLPLPENDPKQRKADTRRANELGWFPQIELAQGLKQTMHSFQEELKNAKQNGFELKSAHPSL